MVLVSSKHIKRGEELFYEYGDAYWTSEEQLEHLAQRAYAESSLSQEIYQEDSVINEAELDFVPIVYVTKK